MAQIGKARVGTVEFILNRTNLNLRKFEFEAPNFLNGTISQFWAGNKTSIQSGAKVKLVSWCQTGVL